MRLPHVAGYYYFTTLNWSASALALRRIAVHQHLWIPKWLCSTLPIGKNLVRWGQPASMLQCPRCGEEESHRYHVIQCKHPDVCSIHENGLSDLSSFLDTASTGAPDLKTGLLLSLLSAVISASPWQPPATLLWAHNMCSTVSSPPLLGRQRKMSIMKNLWVGALQARSGPVNCMGHVDSSTYRPC
jgi:hypothetical protein